MAPLVGHRSMDTRKQEASRERSLFILCFLAACIVLEEEEGA
jgi:hypothetical protein